MAESTTIARPYAEAAFALAREQNALDHWSQMLRFATTIVQDPRVAQALDNPRLGAPEKESLLLSVSGDNLDQDGRNLVRVLVEADRIALVPEIGALFETLKDQAQGTAKAEIETAMALTDAQLEQIKATLERRFGKRIEATVRVNPALIGGARVTVGDTVLDASVQAKLQAMASQLRA
jgi:F-type H+-transporting ATPase subunit delta